MTTLNYEAYYLGENAVGQHLFGNGQRIANEIFSTLEAAVRRFGERIVIDEATLRYSGPYDAGRRDALASKAYSPPVSPQARTEYGHGYIKGLLAPKPPTRLAQPPALPDAIPLIKPVPAKKRGRPRKAK